jgi:lipoprotein NlpD
VPGGGILLAGHVGQEIRAACAGRVVYSGSGLRSYGNLIIIKHSENLLSAYAHNRDSLVRDGQEVSAGQPIAHMGEGAPQKPVLYFEIRRYGKPIDPKTILPE